MQRFSVVCIIPDLSFVLPGFHKKSDVTQNVAKEIIKKYRQTLILACCRRRSSFISG